MAIYPFQSNYRDSTGASRDVMDYLRSVHGYTVRDLTDDRLAQSRGIDFALELPGRVKERTIEFKCDNQIHKTGNIAFEVISNLSWGKLGSCLTSQADYLLYYDPVEYECHRLSLPGLVKAVEESPQVIWKVAKANTPVPNPKEKPGGYASLSLLLPVDLLRHIASVEYLSFSLRAYLEYKNKKLA